MAISVSSPRPPSAPLFMAFFCASHLVFLFSFVSLSLCTHAYPSEPPPSFTSALKLRTSSPFHPHLNLDALLFFFIISSTHVPSFLPTYLPSFLPPILPSFLRLVSSSQRPHHPSLPVLASSSLWYLFNDSPAFLFGHCFLFTPLLSPPPFPFHSHHQPAPLLIPV